METTEPKLEIRTRADAIMRKLTNMNSEYETTMSSLVHLNKQQMHYHNNMKRQEMKLVKEVTNEINPETKKPKYTNPTQRDIALQELKDKDEMYNKYNKEYEEYTEKIKVATTLLDIMKFQSRNLRSMAELETAQLTLLAK